MVTGIKNSVHLRRKVVAVEVISWWKLLKSILWLMVQKIVKYHLKIGRLYIFIEIATKSAEILGKMGIEDYIH